MNKKQEYIESALNKYFERMEGETVLHVGEFLIDGEWYFPKYGCDSIQMFMDEIRETKSDWK